MLGKSHKIGDFRSTSNIQDLPTMKTRNHKHALLFEMIGDKFKRNKTHQQERLNSKCLRNIFRKLQTIASQIWTVCNCNGNIKWYLFSSSTKSSIKYTQIKREEVCLCLRLILPNNAITRSGSEARACINGGNRDVEFERKCKAFNNHRLSRPATNRFDVSRHKCLSQNISNLND